ncbi:alpha/beta hydrolase family protein [[Limnothrix rosea] IAM M-220]|uniref:alpha/beta hydrolase family protein n=1 Tax=[Limnothrix rosea] IAM M-220 TaxID=454133 RepID=UPI000964E3AA|nr:alpha/beta fold hydrolase [[Limnothrix rosea] IAM M-220]OKH18858.1 hypothetical protein NIES208_03845 [[Limnothrix rosea] IAM M-220]
MTLKKIINREKVYIFVIVPILIFIVLLSFHSSSNFIKTKWYESTPISKKSFIQNILLKSFGEKPKANQVVTALAYQERDVYTYKNPLGDEVPVILLSNKQKVSDIKKISNLKIVIALHQTNKTGGEEPCGRSNEKNPNMLYGKELYERGYTVFCPTLSFTGSRQTKDQWNTDKFYQKYPNWSAFGKDVAEISWLIDSLEVTGLDISQIAVIGHSQGGLYALFATALDERINIVIANAGFLNFKHDPNPERWNREEWYKALPNIPNNWTLEEVVATISPRHALLNNFLQDEILISTDPYNDVKKLMILFPSINWAFFSGKHDFPQEVRDFSFSWLSKKMPH